VVGAAADRLLNRTPEVHGLPVLIVIATAAIVMTAAALVLRGDADDDDRPRARDPSFWRSTAGTGSIRRSRLSSRSSSPSTPSR
jgi:hypothetical protein